MQEKSSWTDLWPMTIEILTHWFVVTRGFAVPIILCTPYEKLPWNNSKKMNFSVLKLCWEICAKNGETPSF